MDYSPSPVASSSTAGSDDSALVGSLDPSALSTAVSASLIPSSSPTIVASIAVFLAEADVFHALLVSFWLSDPSAPSVSAAPPSAAGPPATSSRLADSVELFAEHPESSGSQFCVPFTSSHHSQFPGNSSPSPFTLLLDLFDPFLDNLLVFLNKL